MRSHASWQASSASRGPTMAAAYRRASPARRAWKSSKARRLVVVASSVTAIRSSIVPLIGLWFYAPLSSTSQGTLKSLDKGVRIARGAGAPGQARRVMRTSTSRASGVPVL